MINLKQFFKFRSKTTMESLEYLPLYRIRGDVISCCNSDCGLSLDAYVGHFYLFYILQGENKVGLIFQYRKVGISQTSFSMSKVPGFKVGSQSMTLNLIVSFMTRDGIDVLKRDHDGLESRAKLEIDLDQSIKRKLAIWWRQKRGFHTGHDKVKSCTKPLEPLSSHEEKSENTPSFGILCNKCMEEKYNKHFRNARKQFDGYASFV